MAVEILILSGSRQGDRFSINQPRFKAGGTPECQLFFDPKLDSGARDRAVEFQLEEDGWKAHSLSGVEVLVNNAPIRGTARIRSGDVVRLSPLGPDFSFRILGRAVPTDVELALPETATAARYWTIAAIAAGLAVILLCGVMSWSVLKNSPTSQSPSDTSLAPPPIDGSGAAVSEKKAGQDAPDEAPPVEPDKASSASSEEATPSADAQSVDPWDATLESLRSSVYLLAVEDPKTSATWPVASGCAIGQHHLLTSASAITELATFQKKAWKLWAINGDTGVRAEVKSLRVHVGYTKAAAQPEEQIYFDVGLVTVSLLLPTVASVATAEELMALELGFPVACVGVPREVEAMSRFEDNEVQLFKSKVFVVTALPPTSGPRLLHFRASLPLKPYGAPIVDVRGHVYAVYAESAREPDDEAANLHLNYAPVIDGELLKLGLSPTSNDIWVKPIVPVSTESTGKP